MFVDLHLSIRHAQDWRATPCIVLFDQIGQETHHSQVVLTAAEPPRQQQGFSAGDVTPVATEGGMKCVEQRLIGQGGQAALQVEQIGAAPAYAGVTVSNSANQRARVGGTTQRPLVHVQQGQVAAVPSQRAKNSHRRGRGGSVHTGIQRKEDKTIN